MSHYQPLILGFSVYCCPDADQLTSYLKEVHPQIVFGVPRVCEKIYNGVNAALAADPDKQEAVRRRGRRGTSRSRRAERAGTATKEQARHVGVPRRGGVLPGARVGRTRRGGHRDHGRRADTRPRSSSGSTRSVCRSSEIYGMSESSGPMTWSPERNKSGLRRAGHPRLRGDARRRRRGDLSAAATCSRATSNSPRRRPRPSSTDGCTPATSASSTTTGYLRIVDRKKELIITSGGKNISPANLEAALKTIPLIGQAAAIGDNRKFVSAILVLDPETAVGVGEEPRKAGGVADRAGGRPGRDRRGAGAASTRSTSSSRRSSRSRGSRSSARSGSPTATC